MPTWNSDQRREAISKPGKGLQLSAHEIQKLKEATLQAGGIGEAAKQALAENERRFGKR